jgi:hypothetical protein
MGKSAHVPDSEVCCIAAIRPELVVMRTWPADTAAHSCLDTEEDTGRDTVSPCRIRPTK